MKGSPKIAARLFRNALHRRAWVGSVVPLVMLVVTPAYASIAKASPDGRPHRTVRSVAASAHARHGAIAHAALLRQARHRIHSRQAEAAIGNINSPDETMSPHVTDVIDHGIASWYGGRHNGRLTSSGTRFDETQLTAAHAWLPLGSRVRVTSQATGSSVVVTINDRQRSARRVIDLSKAAADELGMRGRGVTLVTITHG